MRDETINFPDRAMKIRRRAEELLQQRTPLMIAGVAIILIALMCVLLLGGGTEETENAYLQAARSPVSASIAGRIVAIRVQDNDTVEPGQTLFVLDSANAEADLREAEAAYAAAQAKAVALKAEFASDAAAFRASQDTLAYQRTQNKREQALQKEGLSARQQVEGANYATIEASRNVEKSRQTMLASLAEIGGDLKRPIDDYPFVREAAARVDRAKVALNDTNIKALRGGTVTRVDQVQVGTYVNPGQPLFWLVSSDPWVEANFKEDQLEHMRVGQEAKVKLDAYPGQKFTARVASFSPGTGSVFSSIPAQNASGNWVKVVQRVPVRLKLINPPTDLALSAGLSAKVTVNTRSRGAGLRGRE